MAPPTSSTSNKGSNPAPDFALFMNKIQMGLDSATSSLPFLQQHRAKAATFIRPNSTPATQESKAPSISAGGTFSSLQKQQQQQHQTDGAGSSTGARPLHRQQDADRLARLAAEEAEFADDRASDANAGVGFARPRGLGLHQPGQQQGSARDRDTKALRGRLLGGRRGAQLSSRDEANGNSSYNRRKKYGGGESSDDEPGRSGLGRAKKATTTKRRRSESDEEHNGDSTAVVPEGELTVELELPDTILATASKGASGATDRGSLQRDDALELADADSDLGGVQMRGDSNTVAGQGLPKAKLKRRKKKGKKSKQDHVEAPI
ncbi:hypothetical protein MN608_01089 [Microdochium nivale]|nr:hypothetical protein MN608_01089 [Microdochium nivale]